MWLRHFGHWTKKVAEFTAGRTPQTDEQFLAACELPSSPSNADAARFALAVRNVFAELGSVDRRFIFAADRYPEDLGILPEWDSMDLLDLVFRLEKELDVKIPRNALPFPSFTVRAFVHRLIEADCRPARP